MVGPGEAAALYTDMVVREDLMQLFGFRTLTEREWHRLLISVQGAWRWRPRDRTVAYRLIEAVGRRDALLMTTSTVTNESHQLSLTDCEVRESWWDSFVTVDVVISSR